MNEFIAILQSVKRFPISESEKRVLYNIINNTQRDSRNKIKMLKKLMGFISKRKDDNFSTVSIETNSLLEKGIIHSINKTINSNPVVNISQKQTNEEYRLTSIGLIHIFNDRYTYSPDFLLKYHNDIFLQEVLFNLFHSSTIKAATAKFFNIITDYLTTTSNYLINLSLEIDKPLSEETKNEIEHKIKIFSLILGFKIIILFNENNIISSNLETNSDKVIFAIHEVETLMKKNLSKDSKFLILLSAVSNEFTSGYDDIIGFSRKDNKHR
ncbi:MAG: hypothetical protein P0116_08765 [Candidatus Nitrosocosmicus sp.]|nr:hypothetical protein [Candidatus Nitrosocosmicus sp.]